MASNQDEIWARGEGRCGICVGLDEQEFDAVCDCSRWGVEHGTPHPAIHVVGTSIVVPIGPTPAKGV